VFVFETLQFSFKFQEDSIWLFTADKYEGSRPLTFQANYPGFSEGSNILQNERRIQSTCSFYFPMNIHVIMHSSEF
jgi:hypothetical protein